MNEVAARYGGRYLSKEVLNGRKKGLWQCANGHTFKRSATAAKSGRWCTQCNEEKRVAELKTQLSDLAQAQGGVLLSKSCRRLNDICQWKCSEGHTWKMLPHVVRAGAWCPECPPKNLIEDAKKLAKKQGGECLSQKCSSPNRALRWACDQNHVWIASTKQVQNGHWCPICANAASGDSQKVQSDPMKKVGIEIEKKRAA